MTKEQLVVILGWGLDDFEDELRTTPIETIQALRDYLCEDGWGSTSIVLDVEWFRLTENLRGASLSRCNSRV